MATFRDPRLRYRPVPGIARGERPRGNAFEPTRQRIAARDEWTCQICGQPIDPALRRPDPRALHIHHRIALANGGTDADSNLCATHAICNLLEGTG